MIVQADRSHHPMRLMVGMIEGFERQELAADVVEWTSTRVTFIFSVVRD